MITVSFSKRMTALAFAGSLLLPGCGSISLVKPTPAADIYDIAHMPVTAGELAPAQWRLVVEEPLADRSINTDRILIKPALHDVQYVASARWSDRVPDLVHSHLVTAFEDTNLITSVGREISGLRRDFELKSEIRKFQIETFKGKPRVVVEISAKLVAYPSAEVVDARVFTNSQDIERVRMTPVVKGFDDALGTVIEQMVQWSLTAGGAEFAGDGEDRGVPKRFDPVEQDLREVPDSAAEEEIDLPGVGGEEGIE
ncbi:MAG: hypothetical protein EP340_07480 [Alphaproteobacteria bacterium]|nr:MAG: hypothetical protein EP340_07480 [Alphaproteobacteria bacterium]